MRVLGATTAGAGHFAGLLPFVRAYQRAGHEVCVAAPASFARAVEGAGLVHVPFGDVEPAALGAVFGRLPALPRTEANRLVMTEVFGRLARDAALPGLRTVLDEWRPDLVLREPAEVASYVAATERSIPHVQTSFGLGALDDTMLARFAEVLPEVGCDTTAMAAAPRWTVVPPTFDQPAAASTGPTTAFRDEKPPSAGPLPPWWSDDDERPLVYVTFGSVAAAMGLFPGLYSRVLDQLAEVDARVLLTLGEAGDVSALGPLPDHVHVERWWPQEAVLPHASVVVGHGGFGTTQAALAAAVPQIVVPLFSFDQFVNARRVAETGVGVELVDEPTAGRPGKPIVPDGPDAAHGLADAVRGILRDAAFGAAAARVADEIAALPHVDSCVGSLPS